ncbi:MAG TPA: hypothetical protein VGB51_02420 [Actinomycetota bacterium]
MSGEPQARWGIALGVGFGGALLVASTVGHMIPPERNLLGGFGLGLVYLGPFALAAIAQRVASGPTRAGILWGAGLAGGLLAFTSLSGVGLPLVIPSGLLIAAGARAGRESGGRVAATALGVILVTAAAATLMLTMGGGRCWDRTLAPGGSVWVERPYRTSIGGGPEVIEGHCSSWVPSANASLLSASVWVVGGAILLTAGGRRPVEVEA